MNGLSIDAVTMSAFVDQYKSSLHAQATSSSKRHKGGNQSTTAVDRLSDFTLALETLDAAKIEPSLPLVALMLETISVLIDMQTSSLADVSYSAQLLLRTLCALVPRLPARQASASDGVRISPVLDLLRMTSNPQTASQALALVGDLVPIVPEQIVQNIMPIFTFMGANIMQRDDASSFRLVDKVCPSIPIWLSPTGFLFG